MPICYGQELDASDAVALRWQDPEALERQAEYRRRHKHPKEMCGHGNRPGSWRALTRINRVLVVCGAPDCATLGAYPRVLRDARGAQRTAIGLRDGCAACRKSQWFKAPRHAAQQQRWVAELQSGKRLLVRRPAFVEQAVAARVVDSELNYVVAAAIEQLA